MREKDIERFSEFLKDFQSETDRGAALVGAAMIDDRLYRLLKSHLLASKASSELLDGANAPLGSLSSRIKMAFALGLITKLERRECELIRRVRNKFAHSLDRVTFADQGISNMCSELQANTPDGARCHGNARQLFINSVVLTSMVMWYRPECAEPLKATEREWEYQLTPDELPTREA